MIICFISMFTFKRSLWSLVGSSHGLCFFDLKLIKFAFTLTVLKLFLVVVVVVMW
ncbi:unnamed protein product [Brassica oleracea var. botrytis]